MSMTAPLQESPEGEKRGPLPADAAVLLGSRAAEEVSDEVTGDDVDAESDEDEFEDRFEEDLRTELIRTGIIYI